MRVGLHSTPRQSWEALLGYFDAKLCRVTLSSFIAIQDNKGAPKRCDVLILPKSHACTNFMFIPDLLLKSYENHLQMARLSGPPALPSLAALYSPAALAAAAAVGGCGPPGGFSPFPHLPPLTPFPLSGVSPPSHAGSFQHLLASISATPKLKDLPPAPPPPVVPTPLSRGDSPEGTRSTPPSSPAPPGTPTAPAPPGGAAAPGLMERDRRSSSIAALRMRAREYEMKLQMSGKPNGIVY